MLRELWSRYSELVAAQMEIHAKVRSKIPASENVLTPSAVHDEAELYGEMTPLLKGPNV